MLRALVVAPCPVALVQRAPGGGQRRASRRVQLKPMASADPWASAEPVDRPAGATCAVGRWPDPRFSAEVMAAFPQQAVANAEEARVLLDAGYKFLDVRTEMQRSGTKIKFSATIPFMRSTLHYDERSGEMVTEESEDPEFVLRVRRKFPRANTPIIVACSNGRDYSQDVLEMLDEEGYTNLVGLQGGTNAFLRVFDHRLRPRDGRPAPKQGRGMKKLL